MVKEVKLSWSNLGRSSVSEMGLRKLWDNADDFEAAPIPDDISEEKSSENNRSATQKNSQRKNGQKNLADADWMNWS